jgi:hypothetical protein
MNAERQRKQQHVNNSLISFSLKHPISSHDNASHTPNPVNSIPNPTKNPRYATTCTPTRGKNTGVWSIDKPQLTPHTPEKVPQKMLLVQAGGRVVITAYSGVGIEARGEVMYPADKSKTAPRESNIDATRSKHATNTGTHLR